MSDSEHISVDDEQISELLEELHGACKTMKTNLARQIVSRILTLLPGIRQSSTVLKNAITSAEEGIRDKSAKKSEIIEDLLEEYDTYEEGVKTVLHNLRNPTPTTFEEGLSQDLKRVSLDTYDKDKNQIQQTLLKTGIFTGYIAVLPISNVALDAKKLNRAGIPAESFAGYTILNRQFVAGISNDYIRERTVKKKREGKAPARLDKDKKAPAKILQEFHDLVVGKYRSLKLYQAAEPISWWDATWYWFIQPQMMETMRRCTIQDGPASRLIFTKWSFPYKG